MDIEKLKESISKETKREINVDVVSHSKKVFDCYCPKCDAFLMFINQHYCHNCGQKLGWNKYLELRKKL